MSACKYPDALLDDAAALRETGMSHEVIARRLEMSTGAVSWHCLRLGADSPNTRRKPPAVTGPMIVSRSGHKVRRFTPEEDATILAMDLDGATTAEIAHALGRRWNSVRGRQMTLARHQPAAKRPETKMFDQPAALERRTGRGASIARLFAAIADCREDDLRLILSAVLEEICAGSPVPSFESVEDEAENWAALASYDELRAWFFACGGRLSKGGLGPRGKVRLVQRLMADMSPEDLAKVQAGFCGCCGHGKSQAHCFCRCEVMTRQTSGARRGKPQQPRRDRLSAVPV